MTDKGAAAIPSLSARLNRALLAPLALVWVLAALGSGWYVHSEVARLLDSTLFESGERLLEISAHELSEHGVPIDELTLTGVSSSLSGSAIVEDGNLMYQVVSTKGQVLIRSADAPSVEMPVPMINGFVDLDGRRVYTLQHPTLPVRIHIASPLLNRQRIQWVAMASAIAPLLLLLPLVGWITLRVSRRELAPVRELARQIREQTEHDLRPVRIESETREIVSLADSANHVFARLGRALDTERALAASAAHELRTPLATLRMRLQNALAQPLGDAARTELDSALDALDRLSRRTEKLLQLSRAESGAALSRQPVNLCSVTLSVALDFWPKAAQIEQHLTLPDYPVMARGDADAIAIALRNLIENAVRHGGKGPIRVEVRLPATLVVTDGGPGVGAVELQQLRDRAAARAAGGRGLASGIGNGLGLSIVALLADRLQARLTLASPLPGQRHGFAAELALQALDSPVKPSAAVVIEDCGVL